MTDTAEFRSLDAEVAEKVMGFRLEKEHGKFCNGTRCPGDEDWAIVASDGKAIEYISKYRWSHNPSLRQLLEETGFCPSSDPVACAQVKAKLREKGIGWQVTWNVGQKQHFASAYSPIVAVQVENAPTEEEAVCRFAIALHDAGVLE